MFSIVIALVSIWSLEAIGYVFWLPNPTQPLTRAHQPGKHPAHSPGNEAIKEQGLRHSPPLFSILASPKKFWSKLLLQYPHTDRRKREHLVPLPMPADTSDSPRTMPNTSSDFALGSAVYGLAYLLSLLRAPLGLVPYLVKLFIFFVLRIRYEAVRTNYFRELINMLGDFLNLALTVLLVVALVGSPRLAFPTLLFYLPIAAECIRLFAERVPTIFSAAWQLIPHRQIARILQTRSQVRPIVARCLSRYCHYYALSDTDRSAYVLQALKQRAVNDPAVLQRLSYIRTFRIIQQQHGLRGGLVRDVARGEVFIHGHWTSDPWLLIGMALRRAPWPFDPRYLQRPFYYMSGANRVTSLFVLQSARYSLPYALFQFGHEIRVARLHFFYRTLRWLGIDIERKVWSDGTFHPDQFIFWLRKRFSHNTALEEPRALYTDPEVIAELLPQHTLLSAMELAERYTYPIKYVEEVLLDRIAQALVSQSSRQEMAKEHIGL